MRQSRRAAQLIQSADCFTGNLKRFWFAHNKWIIHSYSHELHYFPLEPLVGSSDWLWLTNIAEKLAVTSELPATTLDPDVRAWYTPDALVWEAAFTPLGYRAHLVGISILFAQKMGLNDAQFKDAAAILASRQPHNPFFLYLHLGKDQIVANELAKKCDLNASQSAFDQWAWEREESESAWKTSMRWDCAFMYSLLSK